MICFILYSILGLFLSIWPSTSPYSKRVSSRYRDAVYVLQFCPFWLLYYAKYSFSLYSVLYFFVRYSIYRFNHKHFSIITHFKRIVILFVHPTQQYRATLNTHTFKKFFLTSKVILLWWSVDDFHPEKLSLPVQLFYPAVNYVCFYFGYFIF